MTESGMPASVGSGPLAGIRVLDLSAYLAGPYGCAMLADLGADVIKVEPPEGDNLRKYPSTMPGHSRAFVGVNRGKRGIVLDLKLEPAREALIDLVRGADVFVHNFRPSVPARLGIAWEQLQAVNPRLIYCGLSGYGEVGPLKDNAGYDQVLQSMTGIAANQGTLDAPELVYGSAVDYYGASVLALSVSAALVERARTGLGKRLSVSLMQAALAMQSARLVWAEGEPRDIARDMRSGGITGIHPTASGHLYISANTPHFWKALCALTGLDDLAEDTRFDTVRKRAENANYLIGRLRAALAARSAEEWERLFGQQVPSARVRAVEDMFDFPQVEAQGFIGDFDGAAGRYRALANVLQPGGPRARPAPGFGEHSAEVLREQGYDEARIEALRAAGAFGAQDERS
jgi:crotonobetainyl-CoA:carnitine CoA-transferase CaiB-like acyl-CoA transferase